MGNSVTNAIKRELETLSDVSTTCCIHRVPESLRRVNKDVYQPLVVSIGPLFCNDPTERAMQHQKLEYLKSFLSRAAGYELFEYVEVVGGWEGDARQCYADTVDLSGDDFIKMMLVDAAFIIELFFRGWFKDLIDLNDRIYRNPGKLLEVTRDIRLEENQIPFFIVKGLYDLAFDPSSNSTYLPFLDLAFNFFMGRHEAVSPRIANAEIKHLIEFLRLCYLPTELRVESSATQEFTFSKSVTELSNAGVKFKASRSTNMLDISFRRGVLEIPRFPVTDDTESLFRNIMVFEQCHYYYDSYVIDYFAFMNSLINTARDVEILTQHGIIENWLGNNEEVADLFSRMFKQTMLKTASFYYAGICRDLNAYANNSWHQRKAILMHDCCNNPWAVIAFMYAIVLLILIALQTISVFMK